VVCPLQKPSPVPVASLPKGLLEQPQQQLHIPRYARYK
jgi:hypothetical protein